MISRRIQHPGVEINEIDRSSYGQIDNSLPNAPVCLIAGFADDGEDETLQWIDSSSTLKEAFGDPTNEYEKYFCNGIVEVLNRGGVCIASKLPYNNEAYNKFNYVEFELGQLRNVQYDFDTNYPTPNHIKNEFIKVVDECNELESLRTYDLDHEIQNTYDIRRFLLSALDIVSEPHDISTLNDISASLIEIIDKIGDSDFNILYQHDWNLTSMIQISCLSTGGQSTLEELDNFVINPKTIRNNRIRIYDMTRQKYSKLNSPDVNGIVKTNGVNTDDFLGIVPIVTTAANALYFQKLLNKVSEEDISKLSVFNQISGFTSIASSCIDLPEDTNIQLDFSKLSNALQINFMSKQNLSVGEDGSGSESLSRDAAMSFPLIEYAGNSHFDNKHLKHIGIAVFQAFKDLDNNGKVNFNLLESFYGSLNPNERDEVTHANMFIDDIVNSQSKYIKLFSNADQKNIEKTSIFSTSLQNAVSLGFYTAQCSKKITYLNSIMQPLTKILDQASNHNTLPLDIVIDAGVSNIAQLASNLSSGIDADTHPDIGDYTWQLNSSNNTNQWRAMLKKFDEFCKYTRKDCMFIADGLRPFCINGKVKYIRSTAPQNTVSNTILPKLEFISKAINSSYSAGYCDWYYQRDYFSGDFFWIPPSIKAAGVYIYCDTYFHPWSAPAGTTRGVLNDVVDVAFMPREDDADRIYMNQWNYAMSYPLYGIVVEGHKTFQMQKTALDRVNVRRLMLYLEKSVARIARHFVYEGNTPYLRQNFVDTIKPIFEDAVQGDGIVEYAIKCDDELNTAQVIENNEMRCRIAVKPVKVVDYLIVDLVVTRQSASVTEEVLR